MSAPVLEARGVSKDFPAPGSTRWRPSPPVRAVDGVDLALHRGETLGLVGESGSGKSTLGRLLAALLTPTSGQVLHRGQDLAGLSAGDLRRRRRHFQVVFQDPQAHLNPRMRIGRALAEPLAAHRIVAPAAIPARVAELLALVDLPADAAERYPHAFSGGQRQRVALARALASEPEILIADEAVSALDVSIQAQIIRLLESLSTRLRLALLFIAHDLAVVEHIADRVVVMYLGKIVEEAPSRLLFTDPLHPYTVSLLAAVPIADPARKRLTAEVPRGGPASAVSKPSGCPYHPRCPLARPVCAEEIPRLRKLEPGRQVACHAVGEWGPPAAGVPFRSNLG